MKKIIAMLLAVIMTLGLVACGNNGGGETTSGEKIGNALEILTKVWETYTEEEKFPVMGGDVDNMVDGAPGKHSLTDEGLQYTMLVPAAELANIDDAATMINAMMLNNFACGAYHVTGDAKAFAEAMKTAFSANQWMCGIPERMVIAIVGGEYVVAIFGNSDFTTNFETKLKAAYTGIEIVYSGELTEGL